VRQLPCNIAGAQAAFTRREHVLGELAALKGSAITIHMMFRTWEKEHTGKWAADAFQVIDKLMDNIEWYLRSERRTKHTYDEVYDHFGSLSCLMSDFGEAAGYSKGGEGGMNRMSQYLRTMMNNFECIRAVRDTQTPIGLRLFCFALIHISPVLLSPFWNSFCDEMHGGEQQVQVWGGSEFELKGAYGCAAGYFMAVAYVLIVVTLYRVQSELEDPFDGKGDDDIKWESWRAELDQLDNYGSDGPAKRAKLSHDVRRSRGL